MLKSMGKLTCIIPEGRLLYDKYKPNLESVLQPYFFTSINPCVTLKGWGSVLFRYFTLINKHFQNLYDGARKDLFC